MATAKLINMKSILLASLFLFSASSHCEIYKWTDESGKVRYGDKPESTESKKLEIKENVYQTPNLVSTIPEKKVVMYATSWCGYCKKARKYFRKNNIPYIEYDIERDASAHDRYKKLGGHGVPLILYGGKRMSGFNSGQFRRIYD